MPDAIDSMFGDMDERYPGSRHTRRTPVAARPAEDAWDAKPIVKMVRGVRWELFTIGQLGVALGGRAAVTMRLWERKGVLPRARIRLAAKNGKGGRRYYQRHEVELAVALANELGMLTAGSPLHPEFGSRLHALWKKETSQ